MYNGGDSYGNIGDELVVPYGITEIKANAFGTTNNAKLAGALSGVETLYIPRTLKTIGNNAFSGCKDVTSITIPNSVTSIGNYAFYGCCYEEYWCQSPSILSSRSERILSGTSTVICQGMWKTN